MKTFLAACAGRLRSLLSFLWFYHGTVGAVALMLGVMAMGVHHAMTPHELELQRLRCYAGLFNSAGPEPPRGITPLGDALIDALPLAHVRVSCDVNDQPLRVVRIGSDGKPAAFPGSRVAEQRVEYDAAGRVQRKSNYAPDGSPAADASGVAVREFCYNAAGQLTRTSFRNAEGEAVVPRMPGYAERHVSYDATGRPLMVRHLDAEGHPVCNAEGVETLEYEYDDAHGVTICRNRVDGQVRENIHGVALERTERAPDGSTERRVWMNAAGEPVLNPAEGAAAVLEERTASPQVARRLLCGTDGVMRSSARPIAEHLRRSDSEGHLEWECFNAADGLPSVDPGLGYAERVCEYSPSGRLQHEYFWDAVGNPAGCYRRDHTETGEGRYVLSLYTDGSTELRPE